VGAQLRVDLGASNPGALSLTDQFRMSPLFQPFIFVLLTSVRCETAIWSSSIRCCACLSELLEPLWSADFS